MKKKEYSDPHRWANMIVIHGSGSDDAFTKEILSGKTDVQNSIHYYIDDKGDVFPSVELHRRAWHCGHAYWGGFVDVNSVSIGIELCALSYDSKFKTEETKYTIEQIDSLAKLCLDLMSKFKGIRHHHILGHQDIAAKRYLEPVSYKNIEELLKSEEDVTNRVVAFERKYYDPGPFFPWQELAVRGVGLWHDLPPVSAENDPVRDDDAAQKQAVQLLRAYGYDTRSSSNFKNVLEAFQTHFLPGRICGQVTQQTLDALHVLVEKKYDCV